jgi:acyl dehydratase
MGIQTDSKLHFEDLSVGDVSKSTSARTINEYDHYAICGLLGTYNDLHVNKALMENSEEGDLVVPGVALSVIMLGLRKRLSVVPNITAIYGFDNVRYVKPTLVGDTVYLKTEISELQDREDDPQNGLLSVKEDLYRTEDGKKEGGELVATRIGHYLVKKRESSSKDS